MNFLGFHPVFGIFTIFPAEIHKTVAAACSLVMCGAFGTTLNQIRSEMTEQQAKRWAKATD